MGYGLQIEKCKLQTANFAIFNLHFAIFNLHFPYRCLIGAAERALIQSAHGMFHG